MNTETLWNERAEAINEFIQTLMIKQIPVTSNDRVMLECFWTFLLAKGMGMKEGDV